MSRICTTPSHTVDHLRRGLYRLTVFGRCPNPNGRHLVECFYGNRRAALARAEALAAPPARV